MTEDIEPLKTDEWQCLRCGEKILVARGTKPHVCPNPNCNKHGPFSALTGPWTYFEENVFVPKLLADDIMREHHFVTHKESWEIYHYENGCYRPRGDAVIRALCREKLGNLATEHRVDEVVKQIRDTTFRPTKDFYPPKNLLCLNNGILDLDSGRLEPHRPDIIFLSKIPVNYDAEADCPLFKKFLSEVLEEEVHPLIQEMFGYCLLRDYPLARAFMMLGGGNNGKSTLLNILRKFLGDENVSAKSLQDIVADKFAAAELFGKLANIFPDIPSRRLSSDTGRFKMLTGEDMLDAQKKHRDPFKFQNYAKLIFSANELPATSDLSEAFWRRWILIRFNNVFPEGDPRTDPFLAEKITSDAQEMSGLMNWALEGLKRLLEQRAFSFARTNQEIMREWILRADSLRAFVLECLVFDPAFAVPKDDLYLLYTEFCAEHELVPVDKSVMGRQLPTLLPGIKDERPKIEGKQIRVWVGVKVKNIEDIQDIQVNLFYFPICKKIKYIKINSKMLDIPATCLSCKEEKCGIKPIFEKIREKSNLLGYLSQNILCRFVVNVDAVEVSEQHSEGETVILGPFVAGEVKELPATLAEDFRQKGWVEFVDNNPAKTYLVTFLEDYPGQIVPTLKDPIAKGTSLILSTPEALELQRRFGFVELKSLEGDPNG